MLTKRRQSWLNRGPTTIPGPNKAARCPPPPPCRENKPGLCAHSIIIAGNYPSRGCRAVLGQQAPGSREELQKILGDWGYATCCSDQCLGQRQPEKPRGVWAPCSRWPLAQAAALGLATRNPSQTALAVDSGPVRQPWWVRAALCTKLSFPSTPVAPPPSRCSHMSLSLCPGPPIFYPLLFLSSRSRFCFLQEAFQDSSAQCLSLLA